VRGAVAARCRMLDLSGGSSIRWVACSVVLLALAACRGATTSPGVSVTCDVAPRPPAIGTPATVTVTVAEDGKTPIAGATVRVEGNMSHPGMEPVFVDAREVAPGRYSAPFAFTMAGDWILSVDAKLPSGVSVRRDVDVRVVPSS